LEGLEIDNTFHHNHHHILSKGSSNQSINPSIHQSTYFDASYLQSQVTEEYNILEWKTWEEHVP